MSPAGAKVLGKRERDDAKMDEDDGDNRTEQQPGVPADEDDSDDDIGPMPMPVGEEPKKIRKKRKGTFVYRLLLHRDPLNVGETVLPHERLFLEHLPSTDRYAKSFMHRDVINFVVVTRNTDFFITTSIDGHVKLWKKQGVGIEFVKHYRAHMAPVRAVSASTDGTLFASVAEDGTAKVFDVINFGEL